MGKTAIKYGDFYYLVENRGITITKYIGEAKRVVVPAIIDHKKVIRLGSYCFYESGIKEVTLPEGIASLGMDCFGRCKSLKTIKLPQTLREIGLYCFSASGLEYIEIPEKIKELSDCCFYNCESLEKIKLPKNLKRLNERVFSHCPKLREIESENIFSKTDLYKAFSAYDYNPNARFPKVY